MGIDSDGLDSGGGGPDVGPLVSGVLRDEHDWHKEHSDSDPFHISS
jgi:hypothetical protein